MRAVLALAIAAFAVHAAPGPARAQPEIPRGRIVADTVPAPSLEGNLLGDSIRQPAFVYLPPGYDIESARLYPTIYLLHGVLDSPSVWVEPVYGGMTIRAVMDSLIAAGEIREAIVVMPNGRNAYGASGYMNSPVAGDWGDFIARDVVRHVDDTYRTIARADSRAITGHSMGGFGAIRLAMLHPDVFSVAWGMNPCCLCCVGKETPADPELWRRIAAYESPAAMWDALEEEGDIWPLVMAGFAALLSPDPDDPPLYFDPPYRVEDGRAVPTGALERWEAQLPLARVADHVADLHALRGLGFDSAFDDEFAHIPAGTRALSDTLEALGVPHVYELYEGDHRNRISERFPRRVLPWIDARLAETPAPEARVEGHTVLVDTWPPVAIELDEDLDYVGSSSFDLYDVAAAEQHVFVETEGSTVERLYWFQLEEVLPGSDHRYDYSDAPNRTPIGGHTFFDDARFGEAYALDDVDPEGDTVQVLALLGENGLRLPDPMMRLRLVTLDETRRRELLLIYLEGLPEGVSPADLEEDPAAWERVASGLRRRALEGMRVRRR